MKTFTAILALSMLCSTFLCEEHSYDRIDMTFQYKLDFNLVSVLGKSIASTDKEFGIISVNKQKMLINSGKCSFGGIWKGDTTKLEFGFNSVTGSSFPCTGTYFDLEAQMSKLRDPKKGYGLRMKAYGSDWLVIGMENDANKSIDMIIGQRLLRPTTELSVEMNE